MKYAAYKMSFQTGVHFGNGMLSATRNRFLADTLYSALCIEALRQGEECLDRLYQRTKSGKLLFSDSFPYIGNTLYIPKPMINIVHKDDSIADRKKWKKLKYIPIHQLSEYFSGKLDVDCESDRLDKLGRTEVRQMVNLNHLEKPEPYSIGVYYFEKGNGLYFIVGYEEEADRNFIEDLMDSLGYQGIGGKVSSGLGKFSVLPLELEKEITERLEEGKEKFVILTTSLPTEEEISEVLEKSAYLLERRGGFIQSSSYAEEPVKKKEQFFLQAGSVVGKRFSGDIYNVGTKGKHPVWRYGKPLLMEVSG